jgi:CspA family cold shock protein
MDQETFTGTVIFFNKSYGFISQGDNKPDLFAHYSDIAMEGFKSLKKGQKVSYQIGLNIKGQEKATNIIIID